MIRLGIVMVVASCVGTGEVACPNSDEVCPEGKICLQVTEGTIPPSMGLRCVTPQDIAACNGLQELDECELFGGGAGTCHDGACFEGGCGNGLRDVNEVCDDQNQLGGDGCSPGCDSSETCGNNILDPVVQTGLDENNQPIFGPREQCDDGNRQPHDGCSGSCINEVPRWQAIISEDPSPMHGSRAVYDARRGRVVLFGGTNDLNDTDDFMIGRFVPCNTQLCFGWTRETVQIRPPPRNNHAMVYDAARDRVVLFGGDITQLGPSQLVLKLGDTWEWDGRAWSNFTGTGPGRRSHAGFAYDAIRRRSVLFGGRGIGLFDVPLGDTWEWDGQSWAQTGTSGTGPGDTLDPAMAFDPVSGKIVMFGAGLSSDETWTYDTTTHVWTKLTLISGPSKRQGAAFVWDAVQQQLLLIGGFAGSGATNEVWRWTGSSWKSEQPLLDPGGRGGVAGVSDPVHQRVIAWGGTDQTDVFDDALIWNAASTTWTSSKNVSTPGVLLRAATTFDEVRGRTVLVTANNTFEIEDGVWTRFAPPPVVNTAMAYDAERRQVVLFGGFKTGNVRSNETYVWSPSTFTWALQPLASSPPARANHAMVYDPDTHRIVLFGGDGVGARLSDTWVWDGSSWIDITPASSPPPREGHAMGYDRATHQIVVFGGSDATLAPILDDTWVFDATTASWTRGPNGPLGRTNSALAWSATRRRLIMFGGLASSTLADTWEWDGEWHLVDIDAAPNKRDGHSLVTSKQGVFLLGGAVTGGGVATFELRWESAEQDDACIEHRDYDGDGDSGCSDADCRGVCTPACYASGDSEVTCVAGTPTCGDGACDPAESCRSCEVDCDPCTPVCGDLICDPGDCPSDCVCGDGHCDGGESAVDCPADCS